MAKCIKCNKSGLFFKVNSEDLCKECEKFNDIQKLKEAEKERLTNELNKIKEMYEDNKDKLTNAQKNDLQKTIGEIEIQLDIFKGESPVSDFEIRQGIRNSDSLGSFNPIPEAGRSEMIKLVMNDIEKSGYFKENKYSEIEKWVIKTVNEHGFYTDDPWSTGELLTASEKKELGLNTRQKYYKEFLNYITEKGLSQPAPKKLLIMIWNKCDEKIFKKYDRLEDSIK